MLDFKVQHQDEDFWCWAAVAASVSGHPPVGRAWTQCAVASSETGGACCGPQSSTQPCNQTWELSSALRRVNRLRPGQLPSHRYTLDPATVVRELRGNKPICIYVAWVGGGHFLVIRGMTDNPQGDPVLHVSDPIYREWSLPGSLLLHGGYLNAGTWTHTYVVD